MGRRQSARFRMPRITNRVTENRSCSTTGAAGSRDYPACASHAPSPHALGGSQLALMRRGANFGGMNRLGILGHRRWS